MSLFANLPIKQLNKWKHLYSPQFQLTCASSNQTAKAENPKSIKTNSSEYHCLQIVKKYDYENFLSSLLIKSADLRKTAFALRAFNVELAQIRDLTKSDAIAQIRFQFWSDIIDDMFRNKISNPKSFQNYQNFPVASELQNIVFENDLSKHWLTKMVNVRREAVYLSDFPFQTIDELEKYCESCFASLYYLLNEKIVQLSPDKSAGYRISLDHIANHFGKAQGLSNILRGVIHNASSRRCYIPNDVLVKSKCSHEDFLRGNMNDSVCSAVFEVASRANSHLEHSLELMKDLKQADHNVKLVYLSHLPIKIYLNLLQKCDFNIFDTRLYRKNGFLPVKLWWKSRFI